MNGIDCRISKRRMTKITRIHFVAIAAAALASSPSALAQQDSASHGMGEAVDESQKKPSAQSAPPEAVEVHGEKATPPIATSRPFAGTRFWLLDPGQQSVELWYTGRYSKEGVRGFDEHLWQAEYAYSPFRGLQVDVYANFLANNDQDFHVEGAQIEARIAPWRYGEVFMNPALYLEWHPRWGDADRGEVRLLLGGRLFSSRVYAVLNPFFEQNLDAPGPGQAFGSDREMGASLGSGYLIVDNRVLLGAETRWAADQQGGTTYKLTAQAGPAFWATFMDGHLRVTATALIGLNGTSDVFRPIVVFAVRP
jgi:hypothetical protein